MAKSLVRAIVNRAPRRPIPFNSRWNANGGLYGSGVQDRFTYMQAMGMEGTLFISSGDRS